MFFTSSMAALSAIFFIIFGINTFFNGEPVLRADTSTLEDRIKPLGEVRIAGDAPIKPKAVATTAKKSRTGVQIYTAVCSACHSTGVLGAPKMGNAADWGPRLSANGGVDGLVKLATSGIGSMPPKGTCMDCSSAELKAAIEHMSK